MTVSIGTSRTGTSTLSPGDNPKLWLAVIIIVFSISLSIVHTSINTLSETAIGGLVDSYFYVDSY
jgi:hypothetical protein